MIYYYEYSTPIGLLSVGSIEDDIVFCQFGLYHGKGVHQENACLKKAAQQIQEYFQGRRQCFELTYRYLTGTSFQHAVWNILLTIPYGQIVSYKDIAIKIGSPKAYRAVGNANRQNPIVIMIPCHRVVTANRGIGGYSGGLDKKRFLLQLEKIEV